MVINTMRTFIFKIILYQIMLNCKVFMTYAEKLSGFDEDMMHSIKCGLMKWREAQGDMCDKRILIRL